MIIFFESGRLGNQLFQYSALKTVAKDERLFLVGFDDIRAVFDGLEACFPAPRGSAMYQICQRLRPAANRRLPMSRLVGIVRENSAPGGIAVDASSGLINRIKYAPTAYFQSEQAFDPAAISGLMMKDQLINRAKALIDEVCHANQQPIFVHVRRRDYLEFPSRENPAVLPATWYRRRLDEFRSEYSNPIFLFLTDDLHYAHDVFGETLDGHILDTDPPTALATMSLCEGGILSASSFAWWGAYFARQRSHEGLFTAPLHWVGHRTGEWHPPFIESSFLKYA
ncbi:alpha-1,2-fucosyltransferase [Aerolutibacter daejeonensis]|uniref:alpha-1,2-fucosyltransferase n=1 Tax=Aerolutibacter daejeonensis TaxID=346181 RepID=UPI000A01F4F4|nr:alpha-1,2-fucosyltransferase [Lysobacter daejeonensis]